MTPDTITKLEDAFMNGMTDEKACVYAGISIMALSRYIEKHPEYRERKEALKLRPDITAQSTIVSKLGDVGVAQWWLTRRVPEFSEKIKIEGQIEFEHTISPEMQEAIIEYREAKRARIIKEIKERAQAKRLAETNP